MKGRATAASRACEQSQSGPLASILHGGLTGEKPRWPSLSCESLTQVFNQVIRVLKADRETKETLRRPGFGSFDGCPVLDEALGTTHARRAREQTQPAGDGEGPFAPTRHHEGQHGAEHAHLLRRNRVARVSREPGVVNSL